MSSGMAPTIAQRNAAFCASSTESEFCLDLSFRMLSSEGLSTNPYESSPWSKRRVRAKTQLFQLSSRKRGVHASARVTKGASIRNYGQGWTGSSGGYDAKSRGPPQISDKSINNYNSHYFYPLLPGLIYVWIWQKSLARNIRKHPYPTKLRLEKFTSSIQKYSLLRCFSREVNHYPHEWMPSSSMGPAKDVP